MRTGHSHAVLQIAMPCSTVWNSSASPAGLLQGHGLTVQRSCGPADHLTIDTGDGRAWHGLLHLIDEDELDYVRNYTVVAQCRGDRLKASIQVRLTADGSIHTTVTVECAVTSTADAGVLPDHVATTWAAALDTAAGVAGQAHTRAMAATTDGPSSQAYRANPSWVPAAIALGVGLGVGAALRVLARRGRRIR